MKTGDRVERLPHGSKARGNCVKGSPFLARHGGGGGSRAPRSSEDLARYTIRDACGEVKRLWENTPSRMSLTFQTSLQLSGFSQQLLANLLSSAAAQRMPIGTSWCVIAIFCVHAIPTLEYADVGPDAWPPRLPTRPSRSAPVYFLLRP